VSRLRRLVQRLQGRRLFRRPETFAGSAQLILWWELRRLPHNLIVGFAGIVACAGILAIAIVHERLHPQAAIKEDIGSPFLGLGLIFLYGILANVCYTAGWTTELVARAVWGDRATAYGEIVFTLGLFFSVALTLFPLLVVLLSVLINVL
jgi:hypothetical protein